LVDSPPGGNDPFADSKFVSGAGNLLRLFVHCDRRRPRVPPEPQAGARDQDGDDLDDHEQLNQGASRTSIPLLMNESRFFKRV